MQEIIHSFLLVGGVDGQVCWELSMTMHFESLLGLVTLVALARRLFPFFENSNGKKKMMKNLITSFHSNKYNSMTTRV
jgi:hypothetical protein